MLGALLALILGLQTASTASQAIQQAIAPYGQTYSHECPGTPDYGTYCSKLVGNHGPVYAYLLGPVASEFSEWVLIESYGDEWIALGVVPYDGTNQIPWP